MQFSSFTSSSSRLPYSASDTLSYTCAHMPTLSAAQGVLSSFKHQLLDLLMGVGTGYFVSLNGVQPSLFLALEHKEA